jgi:hypothetical protein
MTSLPIRRSRATLVLAAVGLVVALAACSDEDRNDALDDVTELAVRNFAALQGSEQFTAAGYEIDDDGLTCTATVGAGGRTAVEVECTGTTVDGDDAVLTGVTSEIPGASFTELEGDWTATVNGEQVFTTDELGG